MCAHFDACACCACECTTVARSGRHASDGGSVELSAASHQSGDGPLAIVIPKGVGSNRIVPPDRRRPDGAPWTSRSRRRARGMDDGDHDSSTPESSFASSFATAGRAVAAALAEPRERFERRIARAKEKEYQRRTPEAWTKLTIRRGRISSNRCARASSILSSESTRPISANPNLPRRTSAAAGPSS